MWRFLTIPFRLVGRLAGLGIGYLLFGAGSALLIFVFFGDHPDRPGRLVEAEAVVTEKHVNCRIRDPRKSAWGSCEEVERKVLEAPKEFVDAKTERWVELTITFRTEAGRAITHKGPASHLALPAEVVPGDHVRIKYDRKKPGYVVGAGAGGWPVMLLWTAIALGMLFASYVLWTTNGGWRVLERNRAKYYLIRMRDA